jgi:hypothetical protein
MLSSASSLLLEESAESSSIDEQLLSLPSSPLLTAETTPDPLLVLIQYSMVAQPCNSAAFSHPQFAKSRGQPQP